MRQVDHASAVANGDAVAGDIPGRPGRGSAGLRPLSRLRGLRSLAPIVLLAACAAPPGVPTLYEVPDRPHLAPAAERAAIAEELRGEGVAAWSEAQALRSRTGKSALPPPAWLLEPVRPPPAPSAAPSRPPNPEAAIVAERVRSESDDGSLNSFLRQLVRRQPGAAPIEIAADEPPAESAAPPGRRPAPPDQPALDRFLDYLGGRLAVGRPEADAVAPPPAMPTAPRPEAAPAAAVSATSAAGPTPAAGTPAPSPAASSSATAAVRAKPPGARPASAAAAVPAEPAATSVPAVATGREPPAVLLPPPSPGGTLPTAARAELERVVETARSRGAGIEIVGHGAAPALALERARTVARLVVELGLPPGGLRLRAAGPGERVELRLLPGPPS